MASWGDLAKGAPMAASLSRADGKGGAGQSKCIYKMMLWLSRNAGKGVVEDSFSRGVESVGGGGLRWWDGAIVH